MDTIVFGTPQKPSASITPFRSLVRITSPAVEPVSLAFAKQHCRVDTETDDLYVQSLIAVARQYVEDILDITICSTSSATDFQVDASVLPGRIYPQWARSWPATRGDENSVTVRYSAGYGDDGQSAPPIVKHLILLLVAHWFDTRQPAVTGAPQSVPQTFETLLAAASMGVYR